MRAARKLSSQAATLRLRCRESLPGALADQVVGHVLEGGEIGWGVIGSDTALVVTEDHVHHPVQAILDHSMTADDWTQKIGQQNQ